VPIRCRTPAASEKATRRIPAFAQDGQRIGVWATLWGSSSSARPRRLKIARAVYEAARVDGATKWDIVRSIKIPLLMPTLKLLFIFSVIGTSQLFTEAFVLRPLGYVADNITPNLYLYLTAARDANYSYAGAMAILLALLIFVISGPFLRRISSR
jgi:ABC-type sugar transport system permease subunit